MKTSYAKGLIAHPAGKPYGAVATYWNGKESSKEGWFKSEVERARWLLSIGNVLEVVLKDPAPREALK